tara:strand:- start:6152 stop:7258 length:1107 start_codon:yes stop_codon:yes gene_type:complete
MSSNEITKNNFGFFLKGLNGINRANLFKKLILDYKYFIPKYYFEDEYKNVIITNYYKSKFLLNQIKNNKDFVLNILLLNKKELNNIEFNLNLYKFNDTIFFDKISNSKINMKYILNDISFPEKLNKFKLYKSFYTSFKEPLYIHLFDKEYNKNLNKKKFFLELLNKQNEIVNNLLKEDILGILSYKNIFEIIEKYENNKNNNLNDSNNISYKIFGNESINNSNNDNKKRKKFYYKIPEIDELYQNYNINVEISSINNIMKKNFNLFHEELLNIKKKKYKNLYDYIVSSINMEFYFLNFILYYNQKVDLEKIYRLDNNIKLSINKNINLFKSYYDSFRTKLDLGLSSNSIFNTVDFEKYFNKEINILLN